MVIALQPQHLLKIIEALPLLLLLLRWVSPRRCWLWQHHCWRGGRRWQSALVINAALVAAAFRKRPMRCSTAPHPPRMLSLVALLLVVDVALIQQHVSAYASDASASQWVLVTS